MSLKIGYITRCETFNAAHRLNSIHLTAEENKETYGKCNGLNGHGHNYKVEVTLKGPINTKNGMVINLTTLQSHMQFVLQTLDHRNIDLDVPYFKDKPSTAENIAVYLWEELSARDSELSSLLHEVKLWETDKNVVCYRGERSGLCD